MKRDNEYEIEGRVRFSEIDHRRRMTLPAIINYFQDCSIFQSEELGYGLAYLKERKKAWMLSAWQIAILRYPRGSALRSAPGQAVLKESAETGISACGMKRET